jgi:pimeloyl-ACP methyl ester carboxylesterase
MANVLQSPGRLSRPRPPRWRRWALTVLAVVALLAAGGFAWWGSTPSQPTPVALAALNGSAGVTVTRIGNGWAFTPKMSAGKPTGWVLYPGGHVDARAYAPLALAVAEHGFSVALVKVPLSVAFLDVNAADTARKAMPGIKVWAVGGHSLGGVAASSYVASHPGRISGLVLMASYPAQGTDLSRAKGADGPLRVLSIRGSQDGLATQAKIDAAKPLLPADTQYVTIPGGNHAQWGAYGPQQGDGAAAIPAAKQLQIGADAIAAFLGTL